MLHLPQRTHYALLALTELAKRWGSEPTPVTEIAAERDIPERFLAGILHELRTSGLVTSVRGSRGGFRLAQAPELTSVGDVVRALAGERESGWCSAAVEAAGCRRLNRCALGETFTSALNAATDVLDGVTLRGLALRELELASKGQNDYVI
jgi:Rrf2 family transcriptional regulator, cysteine metabolism repressor